MLINFPIRGLQKEPIPISEVRIEIRKIEEQFYGCVLTQQILDQLNRIIVTKINVPYNLNIKAGFIRNNIKLFGFNNDSKAVLDPNCKITHISKKRNVRR